MLKLTVNVKTSPDVQKKIDGFAQRALRLNELIASKITKRAVNMAIIVYKRRIYMPFLAVNEGFIATIEQAEAGRMGEYSHPQPESFLLIKQLYRELNSLKSIKNGKSFVQGVFNIEQLNQATPLIGQVEGKTYNMQGIKGHGQGYWMFQEFGTKQLLESNDNMSTHYSPSKTIEGGSASGAGIPPARGIRLAKLEIMKKWKPVNVQQEVKRLIQIGNII